MQTDLERQIRNFISENFFVNADTEALPRTASLLDAGIIDSTGVLELVGFLEGSLGLTVADDEIIPENLDSIQAIGAFIEAKRTETTSLILVQAPTLLEKVST
jgi:acyl carrier protein